MSIGDGEGADEGLMTLSSGAGLGEGLDMVLSPGVLGSAARSPAKNSNITQQFILLF